MDDSPRDITLDVLEAVFTLAMDAGAPEAFLEFSGKVDPGTGDTSLVLTPEGDAPPWEGVIAGADIAAAIGAEVQPGAEPAAKAPDAPAATAPAEGAA